MTTSETGMPGDDRPDDDALLRARLKQTLQATPPEALVTRVRAMAVSRQRSAAALAPEGRATGGVETRGALGRRLVPAAAPGSRRAEALRSWGAVLPFVLGVGLLVSLLFGLADSFPPPRLLSDLMDGFGEFAGAGGSIDAVAGPGAAPGPGAASGSEITPGPPPGAGGAPHGGASIPASIGLLLLTLAPLGVFALFADLTRGAPTLRRLVR